jgi:hypothetical protein
MSDVPDSTVPINAPVKSQPAKNASQSFNAVGPLLFCIIAGALLLLPLLTWLAMRWFGLAFPAESAAAANFGQFLAALTSVAALLVAVWAIQVTGRIAEKIESLASRNAAVEAERQGFLLWQAINQKGFEGGESIDFLMRVDKQIAIQVDQRCEVSDKKEWVRQFLFVCWIMQILQYERSTEDNPFTNSDGIKARREFYRKRLWNDHPEAMEFIQSHGRGFDAEFLELFERPRVGSHWTDESRLDEKLVS